MLLRWTLSANINREVSPSSCQCLTNVHPLLCMKCESLWFNSPWALSSAAKFLATHQVNLGTISDQTIVSSGDIWLYERKKLGKYWLGRDHFPQHLPPEQPGHHWFSGRGPPQLVSIKNCWYLSKIHECQKSQGFFYLYVSLHDLRMSNQDYNYGNIVWKEIIS